MLLTIATQKSAGFGFLLEMNWLETEHDSCPGVSQEEFC